MSSFTEEQLNQLKELFGDLKNEIKTEMTEADKGVAASLKRTFQSGFDEIKATLVKSDDDDNDDDKTELKDSKDKSGDESPAVRAMRKQLETLQDSLREKEENEKRSKIKSKIKADLANVPNINTAIVDDLTDLLFTRWSSNLTSDDSGIYVGEETLNDSIKGYLETPTGSNYLVKKSTSGAGTTRQEKSNGKRDSNDFESLIEQGLNELMG